MTKTVPLFNLPREFVRSGIFPYLTLNEIGKFDSTVASANQRPQLFEIYCGMVLPIVTLDRQLFMWLKRRYMSAERIKLSNNLTDEDMVGIDVVMKKCLSLDIGNSPYLTGNGLCSLVEQCHSLLAFSSYSNVAFSDAVLCAMVANNSDLLEIAIEGYAVSDISLHALSVNCPKLEMFSLPSKLITDEAVVQLVGKCTRLVDVDLGLCTALTDVAITAVANHCTNLKDLNLEYCSLVTDISIIKLRNLAKLCIGDCFEITEAGMIAIAVNNPTIDHLELQNCEVTAAAIAGIAEHGNKELLTLKISNSYLFDEDILPIIEKFRCMLVLELEECFNLTDATVVAIAANMTQLQSLSLYHNHNFSDECIKTLVSACTELDDLCLDLCDNLTDLAVREIAIKCSKLKDLSMLRMGGLTNASVVYLSQHCTTLESVHLGFPDIDCESVIALIDNSPGLVELSMQGMQAPLSEDLLDLIKQRSIYLLPEEEFDPAGAGEGVEGVDGEQDGEAPADAGAGGEEGGQEAESDGGDSDDEDDNDDDDFYDDGDGDEEDYEAALHGNEWGEVIEEEGGYWEYTGDMQGLRTFEDFADVDSDFGDSGSD